MELAFNELTCQPYADNFTDCYTRIEQFVKTYKVAESHGLKWIRFQQAFDQICLNDTYTLMTFCNDNRTKQVAQTLLSIAHYPFIEDNSEEENRYIQNNFFLLKNGEKIRAYGLAVAYLYNTIGIGFLSEAFWNASRFRLQIEGLEEKCIDVLSVSKVEHFTEQIFLDWKEQTGELQLIECIIPASKKSVSVRDDHGKDVLQKFAEQLTRSQYVIEIVNSLPFNPYERNFIRKVTATGLIEIVLTNTDEGLGLVVKTTGRNMRETEKIAEILNRLYSNN